MNPSERSRFPWCVALQSIQRGENCDLRGQSSLLNGSFCHLVAGLGTHAKLLLAFWTSIGFKPGDFITTGMNEKRTAWLCGVLNRVTHPRRPSALNRSVHKGIHYGQDDEESVD